MLIYLLHIRLLWFESELKEIDFRDLQLLEDLGTGNFGVRIVLICSST